MWNFPFFLEQLFFWYIGLAEEEKAAFVTRFPGLRYRSGPPPAVLPLATLPIGARLWGGKSAKDGS